MQRREGISKQRQSKICLRSDERESGDYSYGKIRKKSEADS